MHTLKWPEYLCSGRIKNLLRCHFDNTYLVTNIIAVTIIIRITLLALVCGLLFKFKRFELVAVLFLFFVNFYSQTVLDISHLSR